MDTTTALLADRIFDGYRWHDHAAVLVRDGRIAELVPASKLPTGWPQHRLPAGAVLAPGFIKIGRAHV